MIVIVINILSGMPYLYKFQVPESLVYTPNPFYTCPVCTPAPAQNKQNRVSII